MLKFPKTENEMDNANIKCPVCEGREIIKADYTIAPGGHGGYFTVIPLGIMSAAFSKRYVCKSCGYLMEFFSKSDIEKLAKKYGN